MKTKKKVIIVIAVSVASIFSLLLWSQWEFISLTKDTFSIDYSTKKELFSFESNRDFHGDGYSIEVSLLDSTSKEYFSNPPSNFFTEFPKRHAKLGDYKIYKWAKTPQRLDDVYRTTFATKLDTTAAAFATDNREAIEKYMNYSNRLLNSEGNYYSMFFREHPYGLYGIDLYIISPKEGTLVIINRQ